MNPTTSPAASDVVSWVATVLEPWGQGPKRVRSMARFSRNVSWPIHERAGAPSNSWVSTSTPFVPECQIGIVECRGSISPAIALTDTPSLSVADHLASRPSSRRIPPFLLPSAILVPGQTPARRNATDSPGFLVWKSFACSLGSARGEARKVRSYRDRLSMHDDSLGSRLQGGLSRRNMSSCRSMYYGEYETGRNSVDRRIRSLPNSICVVGGNCPTRRNTSRLEGLP